MVCEHPLQCNRVRVPEGALLPGEAGRGQPVTSLECPTLQRCRYRHTQRPGQTSACPHRAGSAKCSPELDLGASASEAETQGRGALAAAWKMGGAAEGQPGVWEGRAGAAAQVSCLSFPTCDTGGDAEDTGLSQGAPTLGW